MFGELKRLGGHSLTYAFGEALRSSLAFLLLPLYTRVLTPADYGILGVVGPIFGILSVFMGLGLQAAVTRFVCEYEGDSAALRRYVGAVTTAVWLFSLAAGAFLLLAGPPLFARLTPQTAFHPFLVLTILNACLSVATLVPLALFRARERPGAYVSLTLADFLLTTGLIIFFVAVLRQGAVGNLRAQVLAAGLVALPAVIISLRHGTPNLDGALLRTSLAFSLPLLPHLLGNWALNVSDRIVLDTYVTKTDLGLYTLGYQFGLLLNIVAIALNNAWVPFFYRRGGEDGARRLVSLTITYQVMLVSWLALALALLAREAIELMADPAYWSAHRVVPLVVLGYLLRYLYFFPVNSLFYAKRTRWVPVATLLAAALNIGLNLRLVPTFGIMAAAVNTCLGFAVLAALVFAVSQRRNPLPYEYGRLARILVLALALFAAGSVFSPAGLLARLVVKGLLVAAFPVLLWLSGTLNAAERGRVLAALRGLPVRSGADGRP